MKAGVAFAAAAAALVFTVVSCSPDRIPGAPLSSDDHGVSFNGLRANGAVTSSSSGSLSGSTSGSTSSSKNPNANCAADGWTYASGASSAIAGSTSASIPPGKCNDPHDGSSDSSGSTSGSKGSSGGSSGSSISGSR